MLLAVEGGGFFSSSASGYSKGLTLLLLGQKNEEKPMRVSPWNHYQLVDQESDPDLQLASGKNRPVRGCVPFACFGRSASGIESSPSLLKVEPTQLRDVLPVSDKGTDVVHTVEFVDSDNGVKQCDVKSSLKKAATEASALPCSGEAADECRELGRNDGNVRGHPERRKVQWTDVTGGELFEIREFEPSESGGSDDEFENGSGKTCSCKIM